VSCCGRVLGLRRVLSGSARGMSAKFRLVRLGGVAYVLWNWAGARRGGAVRKSKRRRAGGFVYVWLWCGARLGGRLRRRYTEVAKAAPPGQCLQWRPWPLHGVCAGLAVADVDLPCSLRGGADSRVAVTPPLGLVKPLHFTLSLNTLSLCHEACLFVLFQV